MTGMHCSQQARRTGINSASTLANQFHAVLLSHVPHLPVNMAAQARRYTWLFYWAGEVLYLGCGKHHQCY